jgi:hypothetical protein
VVRTKFKSTTTHVEDIADSSRDAGSIPAASTNAGYKTRLKPNKARQCKLPGLVLLVHVSRVFLAFAVCGLIQSRDSPVQNLTRKRLELAKRLGTT